MKQRWQALLNPGMNFDLRAALPAALKSKFILQISNARWHYSILGLLSFVSVWMLWAIAPPPAQSHWADMSAAEITVQETSVQMLLTFPTGLVAFADNDHNGQLSSQEVKEHNVALHDLLNEKIRFSNSENQPAQLTVQSLNAGTLPPTVQIAPDTHSTLQLDYTWNQPLRGLRIHYGFFLPGVSTAHCLTTINQLGQLKTFLFTPTRPTLALAPGLPGWEAGELLLAIAGAFTWGALHSMSPGHGKTIVAAYLVGDRATPKHAFFLAMTTTITHTIGVFALGLITLFAAQYILPEQLFPWLSLTSGIMVAGIGCNLLRNHLKHRSEHSHTPIHLHEEKLSDRPHLLAHSHSHQPASHAGHSHAGHSHDHHSHDHHSHDHHPYHQHEHHLADHLSNHTHSHNFDDLSDRPHPTSHSHSHSPNIPPTWRNLLALGISGGLVPCPAALVLLLGAIAFNQVGMGLLLVLSFSLGLAAVLTGLGLMLVYTRPLFKKVPGHLRIAAVLPRISAVCITLVGLGIAAQALIKVAGI